GANGPDAAVLAMREVPYDIVLTDYAMPERSGVAFARELRGGGFHGPIVLLTADPTALDLPEALHTGLIQAIVPKPWSYRELVRLLSARVA
ncbi:MAG: response regulator, partial [Myxococcota bacterium]|nr:response regulator [Myxococcota bacterium]